jgi:hypothetical protein
VHKVRSPASSDLNQNSKGAPKRKNFGAALLLPKEVGALANNLLEALLRLGQHVSIIPDSPLEEAGFELSVPPERKAFPRALDRFRRPSLRAPWQWDVKRRLRGVEFPVALFDAADALVPGNGGADMIWASALACSGDFLLRLTACQGKDLIAEAR